jgi:hypothetical protein
VVFGWADSVLSPLLTAAKQRSARVDLGAASALLESDSTTCGEAKEGTLELKRIIRYLGATLLLSLGGCVAPLPKPVADWDLWNPVYVPYGPDGGYREHALSADVYEVRFEIPRHFEPRELDYPDLSTMELTLLRSAEVTQAQGGRFFCIASVQKFHSYDFPFIARTYVSYTIQTFAEHPGDRVAKHPGERDVEGTTVPALHDCYDSAVTRRRLRAKYDISGPGVGSP